MLLGRDVSAHGRFEPKTRFPETQLQTALFTEILAVTRTPSSLDLVAAYAVTTALAGSELLVSVARSLPHATLVLT